MKFKALAAVVFSVTLLPFTVSTAISTESTPSFSQASILHMEGNVEVKAPGEEAWKVSQKGMALEKGSEIKTGEGASCEIGLGDGQRSIVRMKADSQTALGALDADKIRVDLKSGQVLVWARNLPKGSIFEVASPAAVASARGTGWEQSLQDIQVFEHAVEVAAPNGESMLVEEGNGLEFKEEGLGEVFEIPTEAKAEWNDFQTQADKHLTEDGKSSSNEPEKTDENRPAPLPPNDPNMPDQPGSTTDRPSGDMPGPNDNIMEPPDTMADRPDSMMEPPDTMMDPPDSMMEPPDSMMDRPDTMMDPPDSMFDSFEDHFGSGYENPIGSDGLPGGNTTETMNEIRDQQQSTLPPPTDPNTHFCTSQSGYPYPC